MHVTGKKQSTRREFGASLGLGFAAHPSPNPPTPPLESAHTRRKYLKKLGHTFQAANGQD